MLSYRLTIAMTILIVFTFHSKASSQYPPLYTFTGEVAGESFGWSVSGAGDFDGDGYDDLIIGAWTSDAGGPQSGQVYVFSGRTGDTLYVITGEQSFNQLGGATAGVSSIGDFNGDGYDDIIIGARFHNGVGSKSGRAYVFLGGPGPYPVRTEASSADMIISGVSPGDRLGYSTSGAGDVNGDGYDDLIIGATQDYGTVGSIGRAYVFLGDSVLPSAVSASAADIILIGEAMGHLFGLSVTGAGDLNSDGFDDILVGAPQRETGGTGGNAYVFLWGPGPYPNSILAPDADMIFMGESTGDIFGVSTSFAGDINADGYADVIIGASLNDAGGTDAGRAYIFFGSSGPFPSITDATAADVTITGQAANGTFGTIVSGVGDVNSDGTHGLLISATPWDYASPNDSGHAFLFLVGFGPYPAFVSASLADIVFTGDSTGDLFGASSSYAGDVNGDGCNDIIIGAPKNDVGGTDAGRAYVYTACGYRGDVNNDGADANILDLTCLVDEIFRGGCPDLSNCLEELDVNSDGNPADIVDLTFLVDFIFRGGPAPGRC